MKPLSFAESVVAHHHFSERRAVAVAILWLVWVVLPLSSSETLLAHFLAFLPSEIVLALVDTSDFELFFQFFGGFVDEAV